MLITNSKFHSQEKTAWVSERIKIQKTNILNTGLNTVFSLSTLLKTCCNLKRFIAISAIFAKKV